MSINADEYVPEDICRTFYGYELGLEILEENSQRILFRFGGVTSSCDVFFTGHFSIDKKAIDDAEAYAEAFPGSFAFIPDTINAVSGYDSLGRVSEYDDNLDASHHSVRWLSRIYGDIADTVDGVRTQLADLAKRKSE